MKKQYTLGLDIGIASVGWAVLGEQQIIDLGVRCFDKAETAKDGESLNLVRRKARLMRHRLQHRKIRLKKLVRRLRDEGLISNAKQLHAPMSSEFWREVQHTNGKTVKVQPTPWQLRVEALDRKLHPEEWARVIYHLCKHRGFHWQSLAEEKAAKDDTGGEGGRVKQGLSSTRQRMEIKGYRTAAEMLVRDEEQFKNVQRNKQGEYTKALSRVLLGKELALLFEKQRGFGNPHTSKAFEDAILDPQTGLFWQQKAAMSGEALLEMLGKCTFEKKEYRAPKASYSAERHVWLTRLNNLRINIDGKTRNLSEDERRVVLPLPYQQTRDFTYKQLRDALEKSGLWPKDGVRFVGMAYPSDKQTIEEKAKNPEEARLVKFDGWQKLRTALKDKGLETEWEGIATQPDVLDQIALVLSVYKSDEEIQPQLAALGLAPKVVEALQVVGFKEFVRLSLLVLRKIIPYMEAGQNYDDACQSAGYHHSQLHQDGEHGKYLPPLYKRDEQGRLVVDEDKDVPRNPVVLRALNQARKVVNAIIAKYGSPQRVHIEMARDLSRPLDERRKIEKEQDAYRERNERDKERFRTEEATDAELQKGGELGRAFEKFQLYREQGGTCAYSGNPIGDWRRAEVDHILPYSRSFDDSKNNKVLVLVEENRDKGNQIPWEYFQRIGRSWEDFEVRVKAQGQWRQAKRSRLLKKDFGGDDAEDFRERHLNDTRYICRFFKNYVERYLALMSNADGKTAQRCVVLSGRLTSLLRARWGLHKLRSENDRHHALDAAVIAACSHAMVKRMSDYARRNELKNVQKGFVDRETGEVVDPAMFHQLEEYFPWPWQNFRDELLARLNIRDKAHQHLNWDDPVALRARMKALGYTDAMLETVRPLFVSRAPQRRNGGAAHMETIYGKAKPGHRLRVKEKTPKSSQAEAIYRLLTEEEQAAVAIQRVSIEKLTLDKLDTIVGAHDERNAGLMQSLRQWLGSQQAREQRIKAVNTALGRGKERRKPSEAETAELEQLSALPRKPLKSDPPDGPYTGPEIRTVKVNVGPKSGIEVRGGKADNDSMLRVDIFTKTGKFYLVPIYVADTAKTELPNVSCCGSKMDETFKFHLSLYPNDLICVQQKNKPEIIGYFGGCDVASAANINIWTHDRTKKLSSDKVNRKGEAIAVDPRSGRKVDGNGMIPGVGVKESLTIKKFNVDVLGNVYSAPTSETRQPIHRTPIIQKGQANGPAGP